MTTLATPETPSSSSRTLTEPRTPPRRVRRPRPAAERRPSGMALRSRPFQIFLVGSLISWVGDWMDLAALNWAALTMTGSALDLAFINACRLVPAFVLSLPAGVLADRHDRRRLLIALSAATMALTFVVGGLIAAGSPIWVFAAAVAVRSVFA